MLIRILAVAIFILGLVGIVFGALFLPQAAAGLNEIKVAVDPLPLDQVEAKYDIVAEKYTQIKNAEEPKIQAGEAGPSDMYNYLGQQRALLGLAKSNMGTVNFIQYMGIVCICLGLGLSIGGYLLLRKA